MTNHNNNNRTSRMSPRELHEHKKRRMFHHHCAFPDQIKRMNLAFQPVTQYNDFPTNLGVERIKQLREILHKEVDELLDVIIAAEKGREDKMFVGLADLLADLVVYAYSEAGRWGIPLSAILNAVMESQESKLVDGKPIPHPTEEGKFGKGPNYVKPEPKIKHIIENWMELKKKCNED